MKPDFPNDETELTKAHQEKYTSAVYDSAAGFQMFEVWVESVLQLKRHKKIQPLVWNWAIVRPLLRRWMGELSFDHYIQDTPRDLNTLLNYVNDRHDIWGETVPYVHPTPGQLFNRSGVKLIDKNLTSVCKGYADVYKLLLTQRLPGIVDRLG